ncbi:MAG: indolepyruvate oxidoreductase subunit beta [Eubacteriales bacterium]
MSEVTNILIVGVGGQGTILTSKVLSRVAQRLGKDVKVSEIHGMAQRGGSVISQVRYGENVASPIIPQGEADIILAFEKLEALRALPSLKTNGQILINDQEINPMPVVTGAADYPIDTIEQIKKKCSKTVVVDALKEAIAAGNAKAVNVVLIGLLSKFLNIDKQIWLEVLQQTVPAKFLDVNIKAFEAGRNL